MLRRELLQLSVLIPFGFNALKEYEPLTVESLKVITKEIFDDYDRTPTPILNETIEGPVYINKTVEEDWNEVLDEIKKFSPKINVKDMKQILIKNRINVLKCDNAWKGHKDHFYSYIGVARVALQFENGTRDS